MKKVIAGLGLLLLAVPTLQAQAKSHHPTADDLRTKRANLQKPIVRVKADRVTVEAYNPHHTGYAQPKPYTQKRVSRTLPAPQATGWQRAAKVTPFAQRPATTVASQAKMRKAYQQATQPTVAQPTAVVGV